MVTVRTNPQYAWQQRGMASRCGMAQSRPGLRSACACGGASAWAPWPSGARKGGTMSRTSSTRSCALPPPNRATRFCRHAFRTLPIHHLCLPIPSQFEATSCSLPPHARKSKTPGTSKNGAYSYIRVASDGRRIASYDRRRSEQTNKRTNERDNNLFSAVTGCLRGLIMVLSGLCILRGLQSPLLGLRLLLTRLLGNVALALVCLVEDGVDHAWLVFLAGADPPLGLVRGLRGPRAGHRSPRPPDAHVGVRAAVRLAHLPVRSQSTAIMTTLGH